VEADAIYYMRSERVRRDMITRWIFRQLCRP
jgi:hypothetical protein